MSSSHEIGQVSGPRLLLFAQRDAAIIGILWLLAPPGLNPCALYYGRHRMRTRRFKFQQFCQLQRIVVVSEQHNLYRSISLMDSGDVADHGPGKLVAL